MALTPEQTQELRATVEQRREALLAEVGHDFDKIREDRMDNLVGAVPDPGADLDQADASRDIMELQMLEAARLRMKEGSYGTCVNCGQDIGFARLRANPAAERCIECQTRYEKTHAGASVSKL